MYATLRSAAPLSRLRFLASMTRGSKDAAIASLDDGLSLDTPKKLTGTFVTADIWHASWRRYSVSGAICSCADCQTVGLSPSGSLVISLTAPMLASYLFWSLSIFL